MSPLNFYHIKIFFLQLFRSIIQSFLIPWILLFFWTVVLVELFCMAQGCWHGRPLGRVIHTQNITFTKDPGQNIRGEHKLELGVVCGLEQDSWTISPQFALHTTYRVGGTRYYNPPYPRLSPNGIDICIWQVAMVPYRMERGQLVAIAPPSCSARWDLAVFWGCQPYIYSKVAFS